MDPTEGETSVGSQSLTSSRVAWSWRLGTELKYHPHGTCLEVPAGCGSCTTWLNPLKVSSNFLSLEETEGLQEAETCRTCRPVSGQASPPCRYALSPTQLSLLPQAGDELKILLRLN